MSRDEAVSILTCHPECTSSGVQRLSGRVRRPTVGVLELHFVLEADVDGLRIPAVVEPSMVHFLWQHTCFEAFVGPIGDTRYHEINVSPSHEWMVYSFRDYREPDGVGSPAVLAEVRSRRAPGCLELMARLDLAEMQADYARRPLSVGLSAVVETAAGTLGYWALWHPEGPADFHHVDARVLRVEA